MRAGGVGEREKKLFAKAPTASEVAQILKTEFDLTLDSKLTQTITNVVTKFITIKGKTVAKADLQSIIETVMQDERRGKILSVEDFSITTGKLAKPQATAVIIWNTKQYTGKGSGVGPVDAVINTITRLLTKLDPVPFNLTDYAVEIPTTGSDATVEVTMVLQDESGTKVVEKGTSPDIIVASVEAFEKGYNELVYQRKESHEEKN